MMFKDLGGKLMPCIKERKDLKAQAQSQKAENACVVQRVMESLDPKLSRLFPASAKAQPKPNHG